LNAQLKLKLKTLRIYSLKALHGSNADQLRGFTLNSLTFWPFTTESYRF